MEREEARKKLWKIIVVSICICNILVPFLCRYFDTNDSVTKADHFQSLGVEREKSANTRLIREH